MANVTFTQACHLARRAGFAALPSQVNLLMSADSLQEAVDSLVSQEGFISDLPDWHDLAPYPRTRDTEVREQRQQQRRSMGGELKTWWYLQMAENSAPLVEKMTLFWANHFTSSLSKVKWAPALLQQNLLLRQHALGSFRDLLDGIIHDPAMLIYLDNANSRKEAPNENLARELLELFTMGEGQYSETDIKELARALTGASVSRKTGKYQFKRRFHDKDEKTIFNETANFGPDDLADLILRQPQVSTFICTKLWTFFVDKNPDQATIESIAADFVSSGYQLSEVVGKLMLTNQFWTSHGEQIKSPAELIVGSSLLLELPLVRDRQITGLFKQMRQDLFEPPNVKGWPDGYAWYSTQAVPVREQFSQLLSRRASLDAGPEYLLATNPVATLPDEDANSYLAAVLSDPAYQVT